MRTETHKQPSAQNASRDAHDLSRFVVREKDGGNLLHMMVEGMRCASCAMTIESKLNEESDVAARVNLSTRRLTLRWKGAPSRANALIEKATGLGYTFLPFDTANRDESDAQEEKLLRRYLAVSGVATALIMLVSMGGPFVASGQSARDVIHGIEALIAMPTVIYAGRPFFRSAFLALKHKHTNMDVPISVALILTTCMSLFETLTHGAYSYFDSVVMLSFLLLIGRYLDRRTRGKARTAAQDMLQMMAGTATVLEDGKTRLVPIRDLQAGMLLQVAAGEKIVADGVVESGASEIDPSFISGETMTQSVTQGMRVFGGMVNVLTPITVRLTAASGESLLSEIIKLMEKAEQGHARYVRFADRVARYYTPVVHSLALGTFLVWTVALGRDWQPSLLAAMTVLIITCPCAIGLAVPSVQVLASGRLFRQGMLLKSSDALERLAAVDTIVFDKTGTLTAGHPRLANPKEIWSRNMQLAASLAAQSRHPLARALTNMYGGKIIPMDVAESSGKGLEARYEGRLLRLGRRDWCGDMTAPADESPELWLRVEGEDPVRFVFTDDVRADAAATLYELKKRGYALSLLSGDRDSAVKAVAESLGLSAFRSRVTPTEKAKAIEELRQKGRHVLMVGDGLNDAAALSQADVSMSPSSALDITQNAAAIVFQGEKLAPVLEAISVARKAEALVKQNFWLSFLYNVIAVPAAMMGYATPLVASVAMASSSIIVVLNAQRVKK